MTSNRVRLGKFNLYPYQETAMLRLHSGSVLRGGVGTGKSRIAVAYYDTIYRAINPGGLLYIITTAKKRDDGDWQETELEPFGIKGVVDSWNNIAKYVDVVSSFFVFDEQRLVGSGSWVDSFLKIAMSNHWLLLSATPGDRWMDYVAVFIANGFYRNRTDFIRRHVVYRPYVNYPKVERFVDTEHLDELLSRVLVPVVHTVEKRRLRIVEEVPYDVDQFQTVLKRRWNYRLNRPVSNTAELWYELRRIVNCNSARLGRVLALLAQHRRIIIFYNFDYELSLLKDGLKRRVVVGEYNGHKHESVPTGSDWVYLVQYNAGSEGWNCVSTNTIIFYSLHYSYRIMTQSAGRIDRLNTPFTTLYFYQIVSLSPVDKAILSALSQKKRFNRKTAMLEMS